MFLSRRRSLPFSLTDLALSFVKDLSWADCRSLDVFACQSSLTTLSLKAVNFDPRALLRRLAPLAPQLIRLRLETHLALNYPGSADDAHDFIKDCTQLQHLTLDASNIAAVDVLTNPLVSWTIESVDESDLAPLLDILIGGSVVIASLKELWLCPHWSEEPRSWVQVEELRERCREQKIQLVLGSWVSSPRITLA